MGRANVGSSSLEPSVTQRKAWALDTASNTPGAAPPQHAATPGHGHFCTLPSLILILNSEFPSAVPSAECCDERHRREGLFSLPARWATQAGWFLARNPEVLLLETSPLLTQLSYTSRFLEERPQLGRYGFPWIRPTHNPMLPVCGRSRCSPPVNRMGVDTV